MKRDAHSPALHHTAQWGVHRCDCGQLTLKLGALRLDLSREEFASLLQLLQAAAAHFESNEEESEEPRLLPPTAH